MKASILRPLLLLAALLPILSACSRDDGLAILSISAGGPPATRSGASAIDCDSVSDLTVFVFRSDGTLENNGRSSGNSLSLALSRENGKRLYLIANGPDGIETCTDEAQLTALCTLLSDQQSGAFTMAWTQTLDVAGDASLDVEIPRIAAQVRLERITNRSLLPLKLHAAYLTNVPVAQAPLFTPGDYTPSTWANCLSHSDSAYDGWLFDDLGGTVLAPGESLEGVHLFYSLPNPLGTDRFGGPWSPRLTRLVIEAEMEGVRYYYPFTFDNLLANHRYTLVNLNITRPGSNDPDVPVDPRDVTLRVDLLGWREAYYAYTDPI